MNAPEQANMSRRHGVPGRLVFQDGPGGMPMLTVTNAQASATVALQGARLMNWVPHGEEPVMWLSPVARFAPGRLIRGGVPVCWPWFGPHASEPSFPGHGFARSVPWELIATAELADGSTRLSLRMVQSGATVEEWAHSTPVELHITVGVALELELVTGNIGVASATIGAALHTYFRVSDVRQIAIHGLDGCPYIDKVDDGARKQQFGPVMISAETDRIYLESIADCLIEDPGLNRFIRIGKRGSRSTVVWNPWSEKAAQLGDFGEEGYLDVVCVESANAAEDVVTIEPGDEHRLWVRYTVEPYIQS